jgi:hypothetical protein
MQTPTPGQIAELTADDLDRLLESLRTLGSQVKAAEVAILREVDRRHIPLGDGMRTLEHWVIGRMDVDRSTAQSLVAVAKADSTKLDEMLVNEGVSFDRVALLAKAGSTDPRADLEMIGLRQYLARQDPIGRADEQADFERRFLAIQPSLDESAWKLSGRLPALEGKIVADTLDNVADEPPHQPVRLRESRATRRADTLFVVCDRQTTTPGSSAVSPPATVIVDATDGPARPGAWIVSGPKVGLSTLERILCGSPIDVIAWTADGEPLAVGTASTAISPKTRRYVIARDGGICTVDGCGSTYRLQPQHIRERTSVGNHHHTNLTSLCWFHHHVVVHGRGFSIDPHSPSRRRRLHPPDRSGSDPPI